MEMETLVNFYKNTLAKISNRNSFRNPCPSQYKSIQTNPKKVLTMLNEFDSNLQSESIRTQIDFNQEFSIRINVNLDSFGLKIGLDSLGLKSRINL